MVKCLLTKYKALGWILGIKREEGGGGRAGCGSQVPELFQQGRCQSMLRNNRRGAQPLSHPWVTLLPLLGLFSRSGSGFPLPVFHT